MPRKCEAMLFPCGALEHVAHPHAVVTYVPYFVWRRFTCLDCQCVALADPVVNRAPHRQVSFGCHVGISLGSVLLIVELLSLRCAPQQLLLVGEFKLNTPYYYYIKLSIARANPIILDCLRNIFFLMRGCARASGKVIFFSTYFFICAHTLSFFVFLFFVFLFF